MNGRERPRPPPGVDPRRGGGGDGSSRAEKFEDEKKRIIQSCYSKKEADGTLVESYITHVRITEDSAYPSGPPPPTSAPENKKPRVIIVSVRRSGRVRMHKARENNDGSFSIGKTWMLDDLSAILSYSSFVPKSSIEEQQKEWASNVGFVVTIGKPYYWHARSAQEKAFFIGSLVKIFKKYTGGKVPNLVGFDEKEHAMLVGGPTASPGPPSGPPSRGGPSDPPSEVPTPPQAPSLQSSRDASRDPHREVRRRPSEDPVLKSQKSRENISRPSTGSRPTPPPFGPPPNPPPARPPPQRKEPEIKDSPSKLPSSTDPTEDVLSHRSQDRTLKSQQSDFPNHSLEALGSESKRSGDALRPTTPASLTGDPRGVTSSPGSSVGQKSPYRDVEKGPALDRVSQPIKEKITPPPIPTNDQLRPTPPPQAQAEAAPSSPMDIDPGVAEAVRQWNPTPTPEPESQAVPPPPEPAPAPASTPTPISAPNPAPAPAPAQPTDDKPEEEDDDDNGEAHRPGLGPMIKKKAGGGKDVAGAFRKAATAYGAFKPRAGGAGERLLAMAKKQQAGTSGNAPDGITGVVPAPSLTRTNTNETPKESVDEQEEQGKEIPASLPANEPPAAPAPPKVEVTRPEAEATRAVPPPPPENIRDSIQDMGKLTDRSRTPSPAAVDGSRTPSPAGQGRRRRRREDHTIKYCHALGIDYNVLDGRGIDFDDILTDLGWNGRLNEEQKIEDLEADVRREIGRVEATSWLGNLEQQEGKVEQLAVLIDKTIEECEELDGLLTLYAHELNTLHEDVSYIEAQSQGLQVQTANQKLLQSELQNLLKTLSISTSELRPLKEASLSNPEGLRDTEHALSVLYKAMLMIDGDLGQNKKRLVDANVGVYANTEIGQMRAIKEKKEEYRFTAMAFLQRLKQFMGLAFKMAEQKRVDAVTSTSPDPLKLDSSARQHFRDDVWRYNPLVLFTREVSMSEWQSIVSLYEQQSKPSYQKEFRDNNAAWKMSTRKPTGDEHELLFTHQEKEKESEGMAMATARKLTVRRGKTVRAAAGLRLASGEKKQGKVEPFESFANTLREVVKMITEEQNFIVEFFHLNSLANVDYADLIAAYVPEDRQCPDFSAPQSNDPDRTMAKRVEQIMDEIYSFWPNDLQSMVDWAIQSDPMQGIGILLALETTMTDLDDTNQEFITHSLQKVHSRLMGLYNRFVDEQIRGIEDTKVKVNKRKGVISFMRVFPNFCTAVENMLAAPGADFCDIRVAVNDAYDRINRAMWESLKFIAKEAPGQPPAVAASAGDPEDKEVLNYHILLIENMNHYIEEVDVHNIPVLERWAGRARQDYDEHMKLYLDAVIHRPLGKLLDFIHSLETLQASGNAGDIATRASHSRIVAKKVFSSYDTKELKRGIELLKKRVEKHFGDADDPGLSRSLVIKVLRECEQRYEDAYNRTKHIIDTVYEGQLDMDWRKDEVAAMFRK